ncbi:hypothetical protein [Kineosporia succinea]
MADRPLRGRSLLGSTSPTPAALTRSAAFAVCFGVAVFLGRLTVMDGTSLSLVWPAAGVAALWFACQREAGTARLDHLLLGSLTLALNWATGAARRWRCASPGRTCCRSVCSCICCVAGTPACGEPVATSR